MLDKARHSQRSGASRRGKVSVRFVAIIVLLALAGLIGLFVYGQMMEPELREIEVEAENAA